MEDQLASYPPFRLFLFQNPPVLVVLVARHRQAPAETVTPQHLTRPAQARLPLAPQALVLDRMVVNLAQPEDLPQ